MVKQEDTSGKFVVSSDKSRLQVEVVERRRFISIFKDNV